ncbi:MAG TPA: HDOD domain-containing protein [Phycisphaerae bacterium]|nr:HDOD domain-containing protein [Phycisphaerae bacterium]HNU43894.1 HDOD domain-containing protein [Phycisphaerae bacterium]
MVQADAIWNRARADLIIVDERGQQDSYLWEHAQRVARCAQLVARLPEVRKQNPDDAAVLAAALYHDAGWVMRLRESSVARAQILNRAGSEAHRSLGAQLMEKQLEGLLPAESLRRASRAIRSLNERQIDTIEGQIVTDAENLNEVGLLSLWPIIRRGAEEGKDIESVLRTWQRQKEFRFWDARLKDAFRFDAVRRLAERRLERFGHFMQELEEQHASADLRLLIEERTPRPADTPTPT